MKKILIISPYFAPENMVASIRFTKIAKYLKRAGYDVTVICCEHMAVEKQDRILKEDAKILDKIYSIPPVSINYKVKKLYSKLEKENKGNKDNGQVRKKRLVKRKSAFERIVECRLYQKFLGEWIYYMEIALGKSMKKYVRQHRNELGKFDCVISSYGPISAHMLASYMKKNNMCKKWVADYRDVVYGSIDDENRIGKKRKKVLARACTEANVVTAITGEMLDTLNKYTRRFYDIDIRNKEYCVSNGFDEADRTYLDGSINEGGLEFVYCGTIYYNNGTVLSNPRPLFRALKELVEEKEIELEKVRLHYAGGNGEVFEKFAIEYGLDRIIENHGFVERMDSLNLQRNADVILSLSWNTKKDKGIMTGKIYEAFVAQRNVLCLVSGDEPNSDLGKLIKTCNIGFVWEEGNQDDIKMLKKWILEIYKEKICTGQVEYYGNEEEIHKYSYEYLAEKFHEIIEAE